MATETFKALLVIAMFGLLEIALYYPQIRDRGNSMLRAIGELLSVVRADYALQPMPAKRRAGQH
jgi:hypothetical protein